MEQTPALFEFLPFVIWSVPFAIGNGYLAPRLHGNALAWVILSLIPVVNVFFGIYVLYQIVFTILDRMQSAGTFRAAAE